MYYRNNIVTCRTPVVKQIGISYYNQFQNTRRPVRGPTHTRVDYKIPLGGWRRSYTRLIRSFSRNGPRGKPLMRDTCREQTTGKRDHFFPRYRAPRGPVLGKNRLSINDFRIVGLLELR